MMERLHSIYSKTYNFVYLRAKTIVKKEDDVQKLVKEVYLAASERIQDLTEENLYEWLGKKTYILGCQKYRRKKVREAELIELDERQYSADKASDKEKTSEVILGALEELPDMFHATVFAFYFDCMSIKDIAKVMDYSEATMINRLNYAHKYLQKALEMYREDNKVNVRFSVEALCCALKEWVECNSLNEMNAQAIYSSICRELDACADVIDFDERESSGADKYVVYHEAGDMNIIFEQLQTYSNKRGMNAKQAATVGIVVAVVALLVLAIVLLATGKPEKKEKPNNDQSVVEQEHNDVDRDEEVIPEDDADTDVETIPEEYILPNSKTQKLTREDLQGLTKEQLRLARNEIFARYGVIFGVADLDEYFATKSWYTPTISLEEFNNTIEMSLIEEQNLSLILAVEGQ